jgi:hypothetical protein
MTWFTKMKKVPLKEALRGSRVLLAASLAAAAMVFALAGTAYASFGVETFEIATFASSEGGPPATQAGSHPYALRTKIVFNHHEPSQAQKGGALSGEIPDGDPKGLTVSLPKGLIVDPSVTAAKCTEAELEKFDCPRASTVGFATLLLSLTDNIEEDFPVYNMVAPQGVPAELGFSFSGFGIFFHVGGGVQPEGPSGGVYTLSAGASNFLEKGAFYGATVTLFGDPSGARRPFLTLPGSCSGEPLGASLSAYSWQEPEGVVSAQASAPGVVGCEKLGFGPSLGVVPDTLVAGSPSGLSVDLSVPQVESFTELAEAAPRDVAVSLPVGVVVSPSAAVGRGACTPGEIGLGDTEVPSCPDSSKVGSVEVTTPLLEAPLGGSVYLAQQGNGGAVQGSNPFGSLLALYLVVEGDGVLVKVPGEVRLDPVTGRVTADFGNLPQLPFSDLKLSLFGGPRAALVMAPGCGTYTASSRMTPWSSETPAEPASSFEVNQGCQAPGFAPSFTAGTADNQAGAFSAFSVTFSRRDGEQDLGGASVTTPPGLLGVLKSVERCGEPQAGQGTCGPDSLIGHATVAAGPGPDPVYVQGGEVFLTGPYKGAPFGLSIVVPAVAGPFNLGTVVVRAAVSIDPHTAQITVASDPLPTILQGIPLQVRTVNVSIDRPGFMFNPTSCEPLTVNGALTSTQGATAGVSSPFRAVNCANLPFHPLFTVSSQAKTSKKDGASLTVKTIYPPGAQANIRSVAVVLPKQLPARLTTIQQACPEATFNANPASCPAGSDIGTGTASTPILANPVSGPAYLVSHGGAAFPDLVVILQGEGVTVNLVGSIDIKKDVTSSTFANVPDAPISSFQLALPEGPHSGLAAVVPAKAKGSLCGQTLSMPITITAQNGAVINQDPKITVTGCPKTKKKTKPKKHTKSRKTKGGKK